MMRRRGKMNKNELGFCFFPLCKYVALEILFTKNYLSVETWFYSICKGYVKISKKRPLPDINSILM